MWTSSSTSDTRCRIVVLSTPRLRRPNATFSCYHAVNQPRSWSAHSGRARSHHDRGGFSCYHAVNQPRSWSADPLLSADCLGSTGWPTIVVLTHIEEREQRVALEHRVDVALVRVDRHLDKSLAQRDQFDVPTRRKAVTFLLQHGPPRRRPAQDGLGSRESLDDRLYTAYIVHMHLLDRRQDHLVQSVSSVRPAAQTRRSRTGAGRCQRTRLPSDPRAPA